MKFSETAVVQQPPKKTKGQLSFSTELFYQLINWYFVAAISFIVAVLVYQFSIVLLSAALSYSVEFHFGKVDTLPHINAFWSGTRVLVLYSIPALLLLFISAFLTIDLLPGAQVVNLKLWFRFWLVFFGILIGSTLLTLSLFPMFTFSNGTNYFFQGFSVIASWYYLSVQWALLLFVISVGLNITMGYVLSTSFFYMSPPDFVIRYGKKKYPRRIILRSFFFTLILIIPIAVVLSYPLYYKFFLILFLHALLWLPGLMQISTDALLQRSIRNEALKPKLNYLLFAVLALMIILVRIFFL